MRIVLARWLKMLWLIVWKCGGLQVEMWWLTGRNVVAYSSKCGGLQVEMWWLTGRNVVYRSESGGLQVEGSFFGNVVDQR